MATQHSDLDPKYDSWIDFPTVSIINQSGHPGHTTKEQDAQVHQLRQMLEQAGDTQRLDTLTLLRFLRARKFDVKLAFEMKQKHEAWRKSFGTDELVKSFQYPEKEKVHEFYSQYYHRTDKDGRPIYVEHLGKIDLGKLMKVTTKERMLQALVVEYERFANVILPACSRKCGSLQETSCTIIDLKGVGLSNASSAVNYVREASAVSQDQYPERMGRMFIVNAPWGFSTVFSLIKGFLDPVTQAKISVLGSGFYSELKKQIPEENIPKSLGGKSDCENPAMADQGPWREEQWLKGEPVIKPVATEAAA